MRAEPEEVEEVGIRLAVDEEEVWPDVALARIRPFTGEGMVAARSGERFV